MAQSDSPAHRSRVIVVDDDPAVLNALQFALGVEGFDVAAFEAASHVLAIAVLDARCVVLDYALPDMDGLELARRLRTRGVTAPVILIASQPPPAVLRRAMNAGIRVIEKPLMDEELGKAIRSAIAGAV